MEIKARRVSKIMNNYTMHNNKKSFPKEDLFIVGFVNAGNGDCTVLTINRVHGSKIESIVTYFNEGAFEMYEKIVNGK